MTSSAKEERKRAGNTPNQKNTLFYNIKPRICLQLRSDKTDIYNINFRNNGKPLSNRVTLLFFKSNNSIIYRLSQTLNNGNYSEKKNSPEVNDKIGFMA